MAALAEQPGSVAALAELPGSVASLAELPGSRAHSRSPRLSPALGPSRCGGERRRAASGAVQSNLEDEQLKVLKKVVKSFENGLVSFFATVKC
ncbi:hypothetical protein ASZ78_015198 [Callipepla squamata]|uniref:Uncharacterized protein n=1 Tax=Callipepla squamata TaxID=9009 RepID=A0A226NJ16_CALSU|nr:hypothetical protein ASZ78_015198 [Callipepla squamata]